jgi:antitoxin FitA
MATIQIRDIPDDAYEVIRRRARAAGRSIQSYMRDWVIDFASGPTAEEALAAMAAARNASATPGATVKSILVDLAADRR